MPFMYLLVVSILLSGVLIFMLLIYGVATERFVPFTFSTLLPY